MCNGIFGCSYLINSIVWMTFGVIWRFSKGGKVASGDRLERIPGQTNDQWLDTLSKSQKEFGYQVSGGRFMKIFMLFSAWLAAMSCFLCLATSLVMGCCDPREKVDRKAPTQQWAN